MRHFPRMLTGLLRVLACGSCVVIASSCHDGIDTTRQERLDVTLGDDLYSVMCDRLGAGVLTEDLTGASYHAICHPNESGQYGNSVVTKVLPPVKGARAKEARRLSIAKMEAMARRRGDLIRAFNATFPDIEIDNAATETPGDTIHMHDALRTLSQRMVPLYDSNPYDPGGEPLAPGVTRSLGRLFDVLAENEAARSSLARIWGRQGYRPFPVGLGAIRPSLAYPNLRSLTAASLNVLGPEGVAVPQLQQLLKVSKRELLTAAPVVSPLQNLVVDEGIAQPNRPRTNSEIAKALLTSQDDRFAVNDGDPSLFLTVRDRRGFAVPFGNVPGVPGTVQAPFVDVNGDGFADVDGSGRFVDAAGAPLPIDSPFFVPGLVSGPREPDGRSATVGYEYIDTARTFAAAMNRRLVPLLDSTQYATPGDPNAFQLENETLMYAMAGAYQLYGAREEVEYDYSVNALVGPGTACESCLPYTRFRGEESPIVDLVHAAGQVLADPESDAVLLGTIDLLENHEDAVARLVGAALELRRIAKEHDDLAAQGLEEKAELAYEVPVWDQMAQVISRITDRPGLTAKLVAALADDVVVTPITATKVLGDGSVVECGNEVSGMGETLAINAEMRDALTYDPNNINGCARNVTVGGSSTSNPVTPVDFLAPRQGDNISGLQKSLQLIYDAAGAKACNKQGAVVKSSIFGLTLDWPLVGSYDECELFEINDLAVFYLNSLLIPTHPKRSRLVIKDGSLNSIINLLGIVATPDELFQQSSGISGMTLSPDPPALNRLVFYGASSDRYGNLPDFDFTNQSSKTNGFISSLIEPVSSVLCPVNGNGVNVCATYDQTVRVRDPGTIFWWERIGFSNYLRPVITAFTEVGCNAQVSSCDLGNDDGEQMFVDVLKTLHYNWAGPDHGNECNPTGTPNTNPAYCSEAGINRYEPLLADSFRTDILPALHEFSIAAAELSEITIQRGPKAGQKVSGAQVLELITKILFNQSYAAQRGIVDRGGNAQGAWVDGTPQAQVTPYMLFADALHRFDEAFVGKEDILGQWRRARSQLVDEFFGVEGSGPGAYFKNRSTVPMLLSILKVTREQLNANCPGRENGEPCEWARRDMALKVADVLSNPLFAATMDLQEAIRLDEPARRELQRYLAYILEASSGDEALQSTIASMSDMMQVLSDDEVLTPILQAAAAAARPGDDPDGAGCADRTVKVMKALVDPKYDKYHVLDHVLANLVRPIYDDVGNPVGLSPIEIFIDTIADVNRIDASVQGPLEPEDYRYVMGAVRDFFMDDRRGLEQFYTIIEKRPRE
jgi:hypothetical protein